MSSALAAVSPTDFNEKDYRISSQSFIFLETAPLSGGMRGETSSFSRDSEGGPGIELEKLKIGSPEKQSYGGKRLSSPVGLPFSSGGPMSVTESGPLWKDYPMVQKSVPSSHSYCSNPMSYYSATMYNPPHQYPNYRSSSVATIFGGPKSLLSPPKLEVGLGGSFYGRHDYHSSPIGSPSTSPHMPFSTGGYQGWSCNSGIADTAMPVYLSTPLSRSSSQSSGFVSQKGFHTPPPSTGGTKSPLYDANRHESRSGCFEGGFKQNTWFPTSVQRTSFMAFSAGSSTEFNSNGLQGSFHPLWQGQESMAPVGTIRSSSGNTCSRFARNDLESSCHNSRLTENRSPKNYDCISDDEDDEQCNQSFVTARTSYTKRTGSTRKCSVRNTSDQNGLDKRSKSKIRSSPRVRNLSTNIFEDQNRDENQTSRMNESDREISYASKACSAMLQVSRILFLFMVILWMFLAFGFACVGVENGWFISMQRYVHSDIGVAFERLWNISHQVIHDCVTNSTFFEDTYNSISNIPNLL